MKRFFVLSLMFGLLLSACTAAPATEAPIEATTVPEPEPAVIEPTTLETEEREYSLDPIEVEFPARDGELIYGVFYPPAKPNAPVVILMHQYNLDLHEWDAIAPWLQNAGSMPVESAGQADPWLDASWFPELPQGFSVGVLIFNFRGCMGGCKGRDPEGWIMDAEGAFTEAASMPGVDRTRIVAIGTSIGADAAVDACYLSTPLSSQRCMGVFSLSPGSYLNMPYMTTAKNVADLYVPVYCFATTGDTPSAEACASFTHENFSASIDPGELHGIMMVNPDEPTRILEVIKDYLLKL
jgi:hypothetical protein